MSYSHPTQHGGHNPDQIQNHHHHHQSPSSSSSSTSQLVCEPHVPQHTQYNPWPNDLIHQSSSIPLTSSTTTANSLPTTTTPAAVSSLLSSTTQPLSQTIQTNNRNSPYLSQEQQNSQHATNLQHNDSSHQNNFSQNNIISQQNQFLPQNQLPKHHFLSQQNNQHAATAAAAAPTNLQVHANNNSLVKIKQEAIPAPEILLPVHTRTTTQHHSNPQVQTPYVLNAANGGEGSVAQVNGQGSHVAQTNSQVKQEVKNESIVKQEAPALEPEISQPSSPQETLLNIKISNVVCKFRVRCHISLQELAISAFNTEYDRQRGRVMMRLRNPPCYANIWSSGKISIYGATSEANCLTGARKVARYLHKKIGLHVRMSCFEIVNCLGSCKLEFGVFLDDFANDNKGPCVYEPELHAAANFKIAETGANIKIYQNGAMAGTARNVNTLRNGIQEIYPLLEKFRKERKPETESEEDVTDAEEEFQGKLETVDDIDKVAKVKKSGGEKGKKTRKRKPAAKKKPAVKKKPAPKKTAPARKRRGGGKKGPNKKTKVDASEDEEDVMTASDENSEGEPFYNGISAMKHGKGLIAGEGTAQNSDQELSQRLSQQRSIGGMQQQHRPPSRSTQNYANYVPPTPNPKGW